MVGDSQQIDHSGPIVALFIRVYADLYRFVCTRYISMRDKPVAEFPENAIGVNALGICAGYRTRAENAPTYPDISGWTNADNTTRSEYTATRGY